MATTKTTTTRKAPKDEDAPAPEVVEEAEAGEPDVVETTVVGPVTIVAITGEAIEAGGRIYPTSVPRAELRALRGLPVWLTLAGETVVTVEAVEPDGA